jgi:hypothetical protein
VKEIAMTTSSMNVVRRDWIAAVLFTMAMWATRSHYFATTLHLADASWAAFFVAGAMGTRVRVALWLMINASIIDYLALLSGVSSYCVTPAYVFLVPTYLTLWASGRWIAFTFIWNVASLLKTAVALNIGVCGAFIISNASFYVLGGYFKDMPVLRFTSAVAVYLPDFVESTALYSMAAGVIAYAWQHAQVVLSSRTADR